MDIDPNTRIAPDGVRRPVDEVDPDGPAVSTRPKFARLSDVDALPAPAEGEVPTWGADGLLRPGPGALPLVASMRPEFLVVPGRVVGTSRAFNVGTYPGGDVVDVDGMFAPITANRWEGLRAFGRFQTTTQEDEWPEDLHVRAFEVNLLDAAVTEGRWRELLYSTIDEVTDYLEPGVLRNDDGTITLGLDYRLAGDGTDPLVVEQLSGGSGSGDRTAESEHDIAPLLADGGTVDLEWRRPAATGIVSFWVNGEMIDSWDDGEAGTGLLAPPDGHVLQALTNGLNATRVEMLDAIDGDVYLELDVADATDGATTVTSGSTVWTSAGGAVLSAPTAASFIATPGGYSDADELWGIGEDDDATWVFDGRVWADTVAWGCNVQGLGAGAAWAFGWFSGPGIYGFAIGSAPGAPLGGALAGARPLGRHVAVIELDRTEGELRGWLDGELEFTVDASALGAVEPAEPVYHLGCDVPHYPAFFKRLLAADEIAALSA